MPVAPLIPSQPASVNATPEIGVPIGAASELLGEGCGVLVAKESPEAMAAAIVALCRQSADDWLALSQRAHARAHRYSWNDAASLLLERLPSL